MRSRVGGAWSHGSHDGGGAPAARRGGGRRAGLWLAVMAIGAVCVVLAGCRSQAKGPREPVRVGEMPVRDTVYLFPGRATVIPVASEGVAAALLKAKEGDIRRFGGTRGGVEYPVLLDGRAVESSLCWIGVVTEAAGASGRSGVGGLTPVQQGTTIAARAAAWNGQAIGGLSARWVALTAEQVGESAPNGTGTWAVVIRAVGAALVPGQAYRLQLGERTMTARVLLPPSAAGSASWRRGSRMTDAARVSPWLMASMDALERSPTQRWRARLARGVPLGMGAATGEQSPTAAGDMFLDPTLEALATQTELYWLSALGRVAASDEAVADDVARVLTGVVDFGRGIAVPVWDTDSAAVAELLEQLIAPERVAGDAAERAKTWLGTRAAVLAWVSDDAGGVDAISGEHLSRIGVVNLGTDPVIAWAGTGGRAMAADPASILPGTSGSLRVAATSRRRAGVEGTAGASGAREVETTSAARDGEVVTVRVGTREFRRRACAAPAPAQPPGCTIGPLRADFSAWTLLAEGGASGEGADPGPWAGTKRTAEPEWLSAGRVYLGSIAEAPVVAPGATEASGQWTLYLECLRGSGGLTGGSRGERGTAPDGFVRVWLGPAGAPTAVYKVLPTGEIIDESPRRGGGSVGEAATARVVVEARRMSCWIPLPAGAGEGPGEGNEKNGVLLLGVERMDERGVRTAWPRAMMPWESEPGRAAIDLKAWARVER